MYLLYTYIASLVLGGILLAASLLLGDDGHGDADADVDGADAGADADADAGAGDAGGFGDVWLPFTSLRFWVFFLTFFGATGTALTLMALAGRWTTLGASLGMGAAIGFTAAYVIQKLKRQVVGEVADQETYKGQEGVVLLPVSSGQRGKVRLMIHEQAVDLAARTDEEEPLPAGSKVLVIDFEQGELVVVPASDLKS